MLVSAADSSAVQRDWDNREYTLKLALGVKHLSTVLDKFGAALKLCCSFVLCSRCLGQHVTRFRPMAYARGQELLR